MDHPSTPAPYLISLGNQIAITIVPYQKPEPGYYASVGSGNNVSYKRGFQGESDAKYWALTEAQNLIDRMQRDLKQQKYFLPALFWQCFWLLVIFWAIALDLII